MKLKKNIKYIVRNREYWKSRQIEMEKALRKSNELYAAEVEKAWQDCKKNIKNELSERLVRMMNDNGFLDMQEAKKRLTKGELEGYLMSLQEFKKRSKQAALNPHFERELRNASTVVHLSRLKELEKTIDLELSTFAQEYDESMKAILREQYKSAFELTLHDFSVEDITGLVASLPDNEIELLLKRPWAADAKTFSDRIWQDKAKLSKSLQQAMNRQILLGEPIQEAIKHIVASIPGSQYSNVKRLVMTESAYMVSEADKSTWEMLGLKKYQFVAVLDDRTTEDCRALDGAIFNMRDREIGVNAPPLHVYCRSTTIPFVDGLSSDVEMRINFNPKTKKQEETAIIASDGYQNEAYKKRIEAMINGRRR